MAERADLVILGGGLSGLSLAMRLVQSGYRGSLRIIEPRERYDAKSEEEVYEGIGVSREITARFHSRAAADAAEHCRYRPGHRIHPTGGAGRAVQRGPQRQQNERIGPTVRQP